MTIVTGARNAGWLVRSSASVRFENQGGVMKSEKKDIKPVCPHCEARVEKLVEVKHGWFATHKVYCCPKCEKIVGVSYHMP